MFPRRYESVDVPGGILVQTEARHECVSRIPSCFGRNDDEEREETENGKRSELNRTIHEINCVQPRPEVSRRAGSHPVGDMRPLVEKRLTLPTKPFSPLRGVSLSGIWQGRGASATSILWSFAHGSVAFRRTH
jgi:hypothetical protein